MLKTSLKRRHIVATLLTAESGMEQNFKESPLNGCLCLLEKSPNLSKHSVRGRFIHERNRSTETESMLHLILNIQVSNIVKNRNWKSQTHRNILNGCIIIFI